jgi:hypothetical protein
MTGGSYTTQLQAGLGLIQETGTLLQIWRPGMTASALLQAALTSGEFPNVSARRLRNVVMEAFSPRYLSGPTPFAAVLKTVSSFAGRADVVQLMMLCTCRANAILADFIRDVYWPAYSGGQTSIPRQSSLEFVERAVSNGRTNVRWSPSTVRRVAAYLLGACTDFGLLSADRRGEREITRCELRAIPATCLAYDLHCSGLGDGAVIESSDWQLFGLDRQDVIGELKRMALRGEVVVQTAGTMASVSWKYPTMEELVDGLARR